MTDHPPSSRPPPLPRAATAGKPSTGGGKVALNAITAGLTTLLALWLTVADFSFPGTMLFQDSASLLLLGLYLSALFFCLLILAPLPKRLVIGANLLLLARGALGWPLSLVIDYSLACRLISLALLVLGVLHLVLALRRSPLDVRRRPWLNGRHSVIAISLWILIGVLSLPVVALGYLQAGRELVGPYVRVSWSGISLVERVFEKDGRRVHLLGMMHIGDGSFYKELNHRMHAPPAAGRRLVLTEGVTDTQGILPEGFKTGRTYSNIAGSLGLDSQGSHEAPIGLPMPSAALPGTSAVEFRNADIDVSALDETFRETLVAVLEMLDTDNLAALLVAAPEGITGHDLERLLRDGLLRQRNDALMGHFSSSAPDFEEIFIPWGAAHLPDIETRLLQLGYAKAHETVRPIVRFWE